MYEKLVETAFLNAENGISKITDEIINMEGMSGTKTRHFYNNLLNTEDARYLEIGTWKGSSVCSAMCGNNANVTCIDNWSQFGGPKQEFLKNFETYKGNNNATFIEKDCFEVDVSLLQKKNIFMFDGEHSKNSHTKALTHFYDCLDDTFLFIVDDWNWEAVRNGTYEAIEQLKLSILYKKEIRLTMNNSHTPLSEAANTWWNGICIFILKKNKYSATWFNVGNFKILERYKDKNVQFLEIGSFEGMSTNYFLNHLNDQSCITCIDPWIKYSESTLTKMSEWDNLINENTYDIFLKNIEHHKEKVIIKRGLSIDILPTLKKIYDFIYIDGDHSEKAVWMDAVLSFEILKSGGIIIFDDYTWGHGDKSPKNAIDKFLKEYENKIKIISINYQVVIEKI